MGDLRVACFTSPSLHNLFTIHCDTAGVESNMANGSTSKEQVAMDKRVLRTLAVAALVLLGAVAIGIGAYNAGMAQGIAESGRMIAPPQGGTPYIYVWPRPWGFGFFPFFPILFLVFSFFVVRGLLWRGRWHGGWPYRYEGVPPAFEEWHRRAHAASSTGATSTRGGSGGE